MREPERVLIKKSKGTCYAVVADRQRIGVGVGARVEEALRAAVENFRSDRPFVLRDLSKPRAARVVSFPQ